jgi:hypothetical protein
MAGARRNSTWRPARPSPCPSTCLRCEVSLAWRPTTYYILPSLREHCARNAALLRERTKKDKERTWSTAEQTSFEALQTAITTDPTLAVPDPAKPFLVTTGATGFVIRSGA